MNYYSRRKLVRDIHTAIVILLGTAILTSAAYYGHWDVFGVMLVGIIFGSWIWNTWD